MITYSNVVITPIFEDVDASSRLFKELGSVFDDQVFIVAIDDGSVCKLVDSESIVAAGLNGIVIRLKRNVGHQRAIAIGLNYVAEHLTDTQRIIVMDSDGEDVPSSVKQLIKLLDSPDVDVVVAKRKYREDTFFFKVFYLIYKIIFYLLSGRKINFGNFMVFKPKAVRRIVTMHELWIHLAGCVLTSKLRIAYCPLNRGPRFADQSKMNFVGLALHGFKGLTVFAEDILVRIGSAGSFFAVLSIVGIVTTAILRILGFATPGWVSVMLGMLLLFFLQIGTLALMTLLLTGNARSWGAAKTDYREFVDTVLYTSDDHHI